MNDGGGEKVRGWRCTMEEEEKLAWMEMNDAGEVREDEMNNGGGEEARENKKNNGGEIREKGDE